MTFQSRGVFDAIMAAASAHFAKVTNDPAKADFSRLQVLRYQLRCHTFLIDRISAPGQTLEDPFEMMVIILLLIGLETQGSSRNSKWLRQLDSVRKALLQHQKSGMAASSKWETDCVSRHFLYHDVMSLIVEEVTSLDECVRSSDPPPSTLSSHDLSSVDSIWERLSPNRALPTQSKAHPPEIDLDISDDCPDCLMGLGSSIFLELRRIRALRRRCVSSTAARFDSAPRQPISEVDEEFKSIEKALTTWRLPEDVSSKLDVEARFNLTALAECHRLAALLLLYRSCPSRAPLLPELASRIMAVVPRIRVGSAAEPGLTPILFLAGSELLEVREIELCAARLRSICEGIKMMNVQPIEEVLQIVWRERLVNRQKKDWQDVLKEKAWILHLG